MAPPTASGGSGGDSRGEETTEESASRTAIRFQEPEKDSSSSFDSSESVGTGGSDDTLRECDACDARDSETTEQPAKESPKQKVIPSLVADTLRCTAPYGLVQSPSWSLPPLAARDVRAEQQRRRRGPPPILHSLVSDREQRPGESDTRRRRSSRQKSLSTLQRIPTSESAVPKHVNFLYDTYMSNSPSAADRPTKGDASSAGVVETLMAVHTENENSAAQNQDLDENGYADLTKVKTERDAVAFFARHGSTTKTKFLFCNRAPTDPLEFEPYKLVVVPQNQVNPEHFTISETAVMHICPGKPSECFRQDEWMRQAFVHSLLRTLPFFKTFVARKVLCLWSYASRKHVFEERREMLCRTLFIAKPIYCEHLQQIHKVLAGVSEVKLVELQPGLYDITQFTAQQNTVRSDPKIGASKALEVKQTEARALLVELMQKLQEATQLPEVDPMHACSSSKGKSIFQAKREAVEQQRLIRQAYKNQALFGQFILLIDLIFTMRLAKAVTKAAATMLERLGTEETCAKLFSVHVCFGSTKVELDPGRPAFVSMHHEWWEGIVSTVSSVILLSQSRQFEDSVVQGPPLSLESLLTQSKHLQLMKKRIEERILKDFDRAQKYSESYFGIYRQIYEYGQNWDETAFADSVSGHDELSTEMELISEFEEKLDKLNPLHVVGLFSIEARSLKSSLQPVTEKALTFMKRLLWKLMKEHVRSTASRFESINKRLDERPTKLVPFASFVSSCNEIKAQIEDLDRDKAAAEEMFSLLKQYGVRLAVEDTIQLENMLKSANEFESFKLLDAAEHIRNNLQTMKVELRTKREEVEKEMQELNKLVKDEEFTKLEALDDPTRSYEQLKAYEERINFAYGKAETLRGMAELLAPEAPAVISKETEETLRLIKPKVEMWHQICSWQSSTDKWLGVPLASLDAEEIEVGIKKFLKEACIALQNFPGDPVAAEFKKEVEGWLSRLPLILDLGNTALKRRHWETIFDELKIPGTEESTCLRQLEQMDIFSKRDFINEISTLASVQQSLGQTMDKITEVWEARELLVKPFDEDPNAFILGDISELLSIVEDHQISVQRMLHNPYVGVLKEKVEFWAGKLDIAQQVLEELAQLQRQWIGLQSIFGNVEALEQLPDDAEAFERVDGFWRAYLRRIRGEQSNVITVVQEEGLQELLADKNAILAAVQRKLEDYLDLKRMAFPRFYFLSREELIKIVSKAKQPNALQHSFQKCFDGIRAVAVASNGTTVEGLFSGDGNKLDLDSPVSALAPVEQWFAALEGAMIATLKRHLKVTIQSRAGGQDTQHWLYEHPAQCILTAAMIQWCSNTEHALQLIQSEGQNAAFEDCLKDTNKEIQLLALLNAQTEDSSSQTLAQSLLVLMVHARDILNSLHQSKNIGPSCFEWTKQLRYYWHNEDEDCDIEQLQAKFRYRHEYLGCASRLVITPLTDKCFMTVTSALHLGYGGAPAGPAGTGKTETVKDLAKALGLPCLVFNCSKELDHHVMSRLFRGLAQTGAWACFDEFNRIDIEVLSVVAQLLLKIQTAIRAQKEIIEFDGGSTRVDNRQANGRVHTQLFPGSFTERLPVNAGGLFHCLPISMVKPDLTLIAEVILLANGFITASELATKVVQVFSIASALLSQQTHYDWGLRAMKAVLVNAGEVKKREPGLDETAAMMHALRSIVPRLVMDDVPAYLGLVADMFPQHPVPGPSDDPLKLAFEKTLQEQHLQPLPRFVEKAMQLYQTQQLRHGILVVGAPGAGKSTLILGLSTALSQLSAKTETESTAENDHYDGMRVNGNCDVLRVNPKAMEETLLFGRLDPNTTEWLDGIVAARVRDALASQNIAHSWLVLDGPLDPNWAENLNSALDDNKILCLSNGERILLPSNLKFFFEVADLGAASPATVSRCGTVFIEPEHRGWRPLFQSWRQSFEVKKNKFASYAPQIESWCISTFQKALEYIRANCKLSMPWSDSLLAASVCRILTAALSKESPQHIPTEHTAELAPMYFVVALAWGVGGHLGDAQRAGLSKAMLPDLCMICKQLECLLPSTTIYDVMPDASTLKLKTFDSMIQKYVLEGGVTASGIFVPTARTVANSFILRTLVDGGYGCLLTGKPGTGKTSHLQQCMKNPGTSNVCCKLALAHRTTTDDVEDFLMTRFVKRHRRSLGPRYGSRMLFLIDDLALPVPDTFGAQRPHQLLRQIVEYGGFYERTRFQFIHVEDTSTVLAGATDVAGSRTDMRLLRHFNVLFQDEFSSEDTKHIFTQVLQGAWARSLPAFLGCAEDIIEATVAAYERITEHLLPTPLKCHYIFTIRDISRALEVMLMADTSKLKTITDIARGDPWFSHDPQYTSICLACAPTAGEILGLFDQSDREKLSFQGKMPSSAWLVEWLYA
ncbi:LOW QUALITY PROTEIN: uncharacterized protein EMH_0009970 [Eimeria mitis]|uniref:Dynein heavy chain, cytoplasmic n=1 Tax=Eimeria mitis TaxID=44415 RepID=U6KE14_9EIME|nr:LOW QUALITY PROTEIN: uncharacterized protein EMH_0009970 [Eimeria mitis]CDJ36189.1 hypothetical protein EMH_0009970 [Eimeria mitis]